MTHTQNWEKEMDYMMESDLSMEGGVCVLTPDSDTALLEEWSHSPVGAKGDDLDDDEAYFLEDEDDEDDDFGDDYDDDDVEEEEFDTDSDDNSDDDL